MRRRISYVGLPLSGKTTNLVALSEALAHLPKPPRLDATQSASAERLLFVDVDLPVTSGNPVELRLATIPGSVFYKKRSWTRVLLDVDGIVVVVDSQWERSEANVEEMARADELLRGLEYEPATVARVIQANKRDLPNVMSLESISKELGSDAIPASAFRGEGVVETLRALLEKISAGDAARVDWNAFRPSQSAAT